MTEDERQERERQCAELVRQLKARVEVVGHDAFMRAVAYYHDTIDHSLERLEADLEAGRASIH